MLSQTNLNIFDEYIEILEGDMNKIEQFFNEKNHADSTKSHYICAIKLYEEITNKSIDELIEEADFEEEAGIRWKKRKIKNYLIEFRNYLYGCKSEGTVKQYMTDIKAIYRHFEIELHDLPTFNSKQIDKTYEMTYQDVLTKEELIDAFHEANNVVKCIILFTSSSGLSKVDLLNLTVDSFIKACDVKNDELLEQLYDIKSQKDLIPCFIGERQKTSKRYITFCSPEATSYIVQYLIGRDAAIREEYAAGKGEYSSLQYDDKLFDISESHLSYSLKKINNKLELGFVGKHRKFKCHALRKFHATTLLNIKNNAFSVNEIDTLQGRSMDTTHRAYFHNDKDALLEKYRKHVDELMLFNGVSKDEYNKIVEENNLKQKKLEDQKRTINEIIKNQRELEAMLGL